MKLKKKLLFPLFLHDTVTIIFIFKSHYSHHFCCKPQLRTKVSYFNMRILFSGLVLGRTHEERLTSQAGELKPLSLI